MITSAKNEQLKSVTELLKKSKARDQKQLFIVEGVRMVSELSSDRIEKLFVSDTFLSEEENQKLLKKLIPGISVKDGETAGDPRVETVKESVFTSVSDTKTPQGILAVVKKYEYKAADLLTEGKAAHLMILENLQDPGNLGTILRAGEGAGITGIIMSRDTVDIYNPKVVRSTMGSIFRVPFVYVDDLKETVQFLKKSGVTIYAAHLAGKNSYEQEDYTGDTGFLIGNEGNGLTDEISSLADTLIRIPMCGKVESLNAAIAASILMFETARQRRAR